MWDFAELCSWEQWYPTWQWPPLSLDSQDWLVTPISSSIQLAELICRGWVRTEVPHISQICLRSHSGADSSSLAVYDQRYHTQECSSHFVSRCGSVLFHSPFLSLCSILAPRAISTDTSSSCPPAHARVSAVSWLLSVCRNKKPQMFRNENNFNISTTLPDIFPADLKYSHVHRCPLMGTWGAQTGGEHCWLPAGTARASVTLWCVRSCWSHWALCYSQLKMNTRLFIHS